MQVTGALYSEETQNGEIMEAGVRLAGLHEIPNSRTHLKGGQAAAVRENLDDGAIVKVRASAAVRAGLSVHGAGTQPCDEEGGGVATRVLPRMEALRGRREEETSSKQAGSQVEGC